MALQVNLKVEKVNGAVGAEVNVEHQDGRYLAGGIWHAETGVLDISWYAENGENVVNPETGEATNTREIREVWTLRGLLSALDTVVKEN